MKRFSALILAVLMLLTCLAAHMEGAEPEDQQESVYDHLSVGNPTPMKGDFFTDLWGNATSDIDVRSLLHGYNLVMWDGEQGMFTVDPSVVSGIGVLENAQGDRSYVLALYDDLYYSDGMQITAWDYAFSFLFRMAPEVEEIGGTPVRYEQLLGYQAYLDGTSLYLSGVRVLSDDTLMITVRHEYLPFFYELGLLECNPFPIHIIAPGVEVRDDGMGVYLANLDPDVTEPLFTAELLQKTVMDPETGYLSHPSVVSGPYTLTSWDGETADFAINPYFKGNSAGEIPSIPTLSYTLAVNDTMVDELEEGRFDLLNKVVRSDSIMEGFNLIGEDNYRMKTYPRIGLSSICFACERPAMASQAVRQAIAWCIDRDQLTTEYTGSFGLRVDGYYGLGQWMYGIINGTTAPPVDPPENENDRNAMNEYERLLEEYEALSLDGLTAYTLDLDQARALLASDGWELNQDGLLEKEIEGERVVMDLTLLCPEGNNINEWLEAHLIPDLASVGIRLSIEIVPMTELLERWYGQSDRDADMIYMATNFDIIFDPAIHFIVDESGRPNWASSKQADEELYELALAMRETEPGNVLEYMQKWVAFQERFNEILPVLPLYSNVYFDFYIGALKDYDIEEHSTWGLAIVGASLSAEEETEDELDDDLDGFEEFDD
ncbi:MAG: hypothetical protein IKP40_14410 [Clostridia bacterium]|nr:hypothetical protein [Clostridia bacterium]